MRRVLFVLVVSAGLLAFGSATALARHRHSKHHRRSHHHVAVRHKRFGSDTVQQQGEQTAGTVDSFADGVLTIRLTDNSLVSGHVTDATQLECEAAEPTETAEPNDPAETEANENETAESTAVSAENGSGDRVGRAGDESSGDDQGQNEQPCTTAALRPGTVVQEAELKVSGAEANWEDVELIVQ